MKNRDLKFLHGDFRKSLVSLYARGRSEKVYRNIRSIIRREKLDISKSVIYSYWFTDQAIAAWRLRDSLRSEGAEVKAVARAHGYDVYWERNSLGYLPYQDINLERLDGVFPCSDNGRLYLAEKYPALVPKLKTERLGTPDFGFKSSCKT